MKFNFLKFKKKGLPSLESLKPQIFNTELFWFAGLGVCLLVIIIATLVGFNLFYYQYTEGYKGTQSTVNFDKIIDAGKLNSAIDKRNDFINATSTLPKDPSL